jgi:hypothetical protein
MGTPMRPDVAAAFDRIAAAARKEAGLFLTINSAFRFDSEQANSSPRRRRRSATAPARAARG